MRTIHLLAALMLLAGCPQGQQGSKTSGARPPASVEPSLTIALVRSDLGLGDGSYVRELDAVLNEMEEAGKIDYRPVGELPSPLEMEAGQWDVGLPLVGSDEPGTMTTQQATSLLDEVEDCDLLVLTAPALVNPALAAIADGSFSAGAILLVSGQLPVISDQLPGHCPLYSVYYRIKDVAFLCGVAAAVSSNTGMFTVLASEADPDADEFLDAVEKGAKYMTTGAQVLTAIVPVGEDGEVTTESFKRTLLRVFEEGGPAFKCNHFIVALGRSTPSIMLALSSNPTNGYVVGAYADYRQVRPARVVGCALKRPGMALRYILDNLHTGVDLADLAEDGVITVGLEEEAVGFTSFELYGRSNPDSEDIEQAVRDAEKYIRAGELEYDY